MNTKIQKKSIQDLLNDERIIRKRVTSNQITIRTTKEFTVNDAIEFYKLGWCLAPAPGIINQYIFER